MGLSIGEQFLDVERPAPMAIKHDIRARLSNGLVRDHAFSLDEKNFDLSEAQREPGIKLARIMHGGLAGVV